MNRDSELVIRNARRSDMGAINDIYNYYVRETPITFDLLESDLQEREIWFDQFTEKGRHQLLVAEQGSELIGYVGSLPFRKKQAYDTSVETTIYVRQGSEGQGLGRSLYETLLPRLGEAGVHMVLAGLTIPNDKSQKLHEKLGFSLVGTYHEVGFKFGQYWDVAWYELKLGS